MSTPLERLQMAMRGELPMMAFPSLLGLRLTSVQPRHIVMEYEINEQHKNVDTLNAGVFCTMAEYVMTPAFNSTLGDGEFSNMLEMKINFTKSVRKGKLAAVGKSLKGGRTIALVECDILDDSQQLVAHAVGTCLKLESK